MPDDTQTEFCWLVEEFAPNGNSTGRYMLDMGSLAITHDVYAARRLRREQSAGFRALDMKERHGGDWRPVEHGFEPAPAAQPAMPEPVALVQFLEGLLSTWGRPPTEQELRAAAHALTVRADRIACARTPESDGA